MASTPANQPEQTLPLFYQTVVPLSSMEHATWGMKNRDNLEFARHSHAIPVTVDEFAMAQRSFPIVFGVGDAAAPLALLGLQEGSNLYLDADGQWEANT